MDIKQIKLYASNFEATKHFYQTILGFTILSEGINNFTIKVGKSSITFLKALLKDKPFYHFAFDVPCNQFEEAKTWLKERVTLSESKGRDEIYFESIDAKSIYFEDPAGNVVELICRFSDAIHSNKAFTVSSLQKVSEMSLVTNDKLKTAASLKKVGIYERDNESVSSEGLDFMGDRKDATYLLLVNENRTWFFSEKKSVAFPIGIVLETGTKIEIDKQLNFVCH